MDAHPNRLGMGIHNSSVKKHVGGYKILDEGIDLADEFHTYGLEWNEDEIVWYFDGKEIRREKNDWCHVKAPVWLSLAIKKGSGRVTNAIDGTSMDVDYVRVYQIDE